MTKKEIELKIEKLKEEVRKFVFDKLYDDGKPSFERLNYTKRIIKILLENIPEIKRKKYQMKVPIKKSIEYARLFLSSLGDEYANYLDERLNDGTINFCSLKDSYELGIPNVSYATYEDDKRFISLIYNENLSDVYFIIHEIFHDMNLIVDLEDANYNPATRDSFTEFISILATTLARDFFEKNFPNKKEFKYDIVSQYFGLYHKTVKLDFIIKIVDIYLNEGYISDKHLIDILENKSEFYLRSAIECIEKVDKLEELDIYNEERYLTGFLLTEYVLNSNTKYNDKVKVLKDLNEIIMTYPSALILNYLDLEYVVSNGYFVNLTEDSLTKIEESYIKEGKKL